ncbi:MAG: hypothetical protein P8Y66_06060 [Nitrospirota bacterium]|jgi:DNA-directed RNA polymerase subunit RPC12/RpoP
MLKEGCPGSREIRSPYPEPLRCAYCEAENEIWSDEPETRCRSCGRTIDRKMREICILWCPSAKECVGIEKYERITRALRGSASGPHK